MQLYNGLVTLGMVPVKAVSGGDWRDQIIWAKHYLGISQKVRRDGLTWLLPGDPASIGALLIHEPKVADYLISKFIPGQVFVDVGAMVGGYSVRAAAKGMTVFSFEPNPRNLKLLNQNAAVNNVSLNIEPFALGAYNGNVRLTLNDGLSRITSEGGVEVDMRTLDSLGLKSLNLVKIDVEGYELEVLRGARETLNRFHPSLVVEMHNWAGAENDAELFGLLTRLGYKLEYLDIISQARHLAAT
jgi:FkbM family methyltransferase